MAATWSSNSVSGPGAAHEREVDDREPVQAEAAEVAFDALAELVRFVRGEDAASAVPARTDLGDDHQLRRIRVERLG